MKDSALAALGLNKKQIAVYLANLQLGSALVHDIASAARMNRTSTYDILHSLERQGFASHTISGGKKYYQAAKPAALFGLLKEKENLLRGAIGELERMEGAVVRKPSVEVFVGVNGIRTLFAYVLREARRLDAISSLDSVLKLFKYEFPHFVEERKRRGIPIRIIIDKRPLDPDAPYRIINKRLKTLMWIFDGHILSISLEEKEPIGMLVKDRNLYKTQQMLFDALWDALPTPRSAAGTLQAPRSGARASRRAAGAAGYSRAPRGASARRRSTYTGAGRGRPGRSAR